MKKKHIPNIKNTFLSIFFLTIPQDLGIFQELITTFFQPVLYLMRMRTS